MKASNIQRTYKVTLEMTEDEVRDLLYTLENGHEYTTAEELVPILRDMLSQPPCDNKKE